MASLPLLFAGLAFAGVNLPGARQDAFESVGIELPNQTTDDDTEGTAKDGDSAGSATGQENSSGKLGHGKTKAKKGKALGHEKAKNGQGARQERARARPAQGQVRATRSASATPRGQQRRSGSTEAAGKK